MAGSLKWFVYTADNGSQYGVKLDESNAKAAGFPDYAGGAAGSFPQLPRGARMRYANVVSGQVKRRIYVPSTTAPLWTNPATTVPLLDFSTSAAGVPVTATPVTAVVTSLVGERFRRPFVGDTGLTDGTP